MTDRTVTIEGMGDRGVSDAIGFVLVFAIIVSTLSVVYVAGFRSLDDAREFERMNNAERAFDVLDDNVEDIVQRGAPSRATEVKLADAALMAGDPVTINVTVRRASDHDLNMSYEFTLRPIVFEAGKSNAVVYSMAATFRESTGGTVMTNQPGMLLSDERVYLPIVQTRFRGGQELQGSLTALIRTSYSTSSVLVSNTTASDVVINISTPRADAWRNYFQDSDVSTVDCPDSTNNDTFVSCTLQSVDRTYVTRIAIDYEYIK